MNQHKYLRAYMAGIVAPTIFLLVVVMGFTILRLCLQCPRSARARDRVSDGRRAQLLGPLECFLCGVRSRLHLSIGLHGALLPFLLAPLGIVLTSLLNFSIPGFARHAFPILAPLVLILYYLLWKYLVGFLNRVVNLA